MAIENLRKALSCMPFGTNNPVRENPAFDKVLREDCELASFLCPNKERALQAVIRTWAKLPNAASAQHDNQRPRYHADTPRAPYRPIKEFSLRRLLLLTELTKHQLEIEKQAASKGQLPGNGYYLRCYCQQMAIWFLNHTSWDTVTAMTQFWRSYSAESTLSLYHSIADKRRSETKDASCVSRTKDKIMSHQAERFGSLLQLTEKKPFRFVSRPSSPEEALLVSGIFKMLLPLPSIPPTVPSVIRKLFQGENMTEMNLNRALTDFDLFNALASKAKITTDKNEFLIPEFFGLTPNGAGFDDKRTDLVSISSLDIDRVTVAIHEEQRKQSRIRPFALNISVDGVTRCSLDLDNLSCSFIAEEGAAIVDINAEKDSDSITLGTYVLMHGEGTKTECWNQSIEGLGRLSIRIQYNVDGTVIVNPELHVPAPYDPVGFWKFDSDPNGVPICSHNVCLVGAGGTAKSLITGALLQGMRERFDEYQITGVWQTDFPPLESTHWYHDHCFSHDPFKIDGTATVIEFETLQSERLTLWDISPTEKNLDIERAFTGLEFQPNLSIGVIDTGRFDRSEAWQLIESLKRIGSKAVTIVLTKTVMSTDWLGHLQLFRCKWEVEELLERAGYHRDGGSRVVPIATLDQLNDANGAPEWAVNCLLDSIQEVAHPRSGGFSWGVLGEAFGGVLIKISGIKKEAAREGGVIDILPHRPLTWLYPFEDYFGRKSGWNSIYKKYLSRVSAIVRAKAFEKERSLAGDGITEAEDWKEFALARAVWASLASPRFHPKPPLLETRLCDLLCAFGKEDIKAKAIAATIIHECVAPTGRLNVRQLSMTLVRELKLPEKAAWALEESLGLPPLGENLEGGGPHTAHLDESCLV